MATGTSDKIGIVIGIITVGLCVYGFSVLEKDGASSPPPAPDLASSPWSWTRQEYEGLSMELPGVMTRQTPTVSQEKMREYTDYDAFVLQGTGWGVAFVHAIQVEGNVEFESALAGGIKKIQSMPGVSNVASDAADLTIEGLAAKRMRITYTQENTVTETHVLLIGRGREKWLITLTGLQDRVRKHADRIFDSVKVVR